MTNRIGLGIAGTTATFMYKLGDLIAMAVNAADAHSDVVLMADGEAAATVISVAKGTTTTDGAKDTEVYFAKAGETEVACLTAAYNVTVTLDQVD